MTTYRPGGHWGRTLVREGVLPPDEQGRRPDDAIVGLIDFPELTARICALLNGDTARECAEETPSWDHFTPEQMDSYWIRCTLSGPHDEHKDENTGLTWRTARDGDAPSARAISPQAAQNGPAVPAPTLGHLSGSEALRRQMLAWVEMIEQDVDWSRGDIYRALGEMRRAAAGLNQRCICNDPPPTVDKPKNGTASRPDGWTCPRHGAVI